MTYAKDAAPPFYHGTRADLKVGDLIVSGHVSNYGDSKPMSWVYFSASLEAATWGCELAKGDAREHIYIVEPTGEFVDDPNLTDKRFPGNPTKSYRSLSPLKIIGELEAWEPHPPEILQQMKDNLAKLGADGEAQVID